MEFIERQVIEEYKRKKVADADPESDQKGEQRVPPGEDEKDTFTISESFGYYGNLRKLETLNEDELWIRFSLMVCAVGKSISDANQFSFYQNRTKAMFSMRAVSNESRNKMLAESVPPMPVLYGIKRYFGLLPGFKSALCQQMIPMTYQDGLTAGHNLRTVASVVRLWKHLNMMRIRMISKLLAVCGPSLVDLIPAVGDELRCFETEISRIRAESTLTPYSAMVSPQKLEGLKSQDFKELLKLARALYIKFEPKMKHYAPNLGSSVYEGRLIAFIDEITHADCRPGVKPVPESELKQSLKVPVRITSSWEIRSENWEHYMHHAAR